MQPGVCEQRTKDFKILFLFNYLRFIYTALAIISISLDNIVFTFIQSVNSERKKQTLLSMLHRKTAYAVCCMLYWEVSLEIFLQQTGHFTFLDPPNLAYLMVCLKY